MLICHLGLADNEKHIFEILQILRLEFSNYDCNSRGDISAKDFALSSVASADINHINKMLDQVDELSNEPHLRGIRITIESATLPTGCDVECHKRLWLH